ncbi:MAG: MotA/TolQ/ExbB proton channel family protein [Eubacteriales bacterium]|nr:MotA/TolQ/ExbB proton channel family protein [Eubacteriales bacterium]
MFFVEIAGTGIANTETAASGSFLTDAMHAISSAMKYPVIIILMLLFAAALVCVGWLIAEYFTERKHLNAKLPQLIDDIRGSDDAIEECIERSGLLRRQKAALFELTMHPDLTPDMREALAVRLITEEQTRYDKIVKITDIIVKLGPVFGLLGTLIPLGPGIIALGQGNTALLSQSLNVAFDTTIIGLICAAIALVVSSIRKAWYRNYMSMLETVMEAVLEMQK